MQLILNIPEFALLTLNKDIQELKQTLVALKLPPLNIPNIIPIKNHNKHI